MHKRIYIQLPESKKKSAKGHSLTGLVYIIFFASFSPPLSQQLWAQAEKNLRDSNNVNRSVPPLEVWVEDPITHNLAGYNLQGWNEDFYNSGKLQRKAYYVNGKVIVSRKYFENGTCERTVENPDPQHCNVTIYFENGNPRQKINYYNGKPQKFYEFYESGQPRYAEENEKEMKYLTLRKSWYVNGNLESDLKLVERKNKKYSQKKYYSNGHLREEGTILLLSGTQDYVKDGSWDVYDSIGKGKGLEKFSHGIKLNSSQ